LTIVDEWVNLYSAFKAFCEGCDGFNILSHPAFVKPDIKFLINAQTEQVKAQYVNKGSIAPQILTRSLDIYALARNTNCR